MAGQELRMLHIPVNQNFGSGLPTAWQTLHGHANGGDFSNAIKAAAAAHYGHAGPAFVRGLVADPERWRAEARRQVEEFARRALRDGDSGQIARAVARFGAVAAAGEIAAALEVVPWPAGMAQRAALDLFEQWAEGFGRSGAREERQVLETVRNALLMNRSAFGTVPRERRADEADEGGTVASTREGEARALKEWGYLHAIGAKPHYLISEPGWADILKGFDLRFAADVLLNRGLMLRGDGGRRTRKQRISGQGVRFYTVSADILEWDGHDPEPEQAEAVASIEPDGAVVGDPMSDDLDPFGPAGDGWEPSGWN